MIHREALVAKKLSPELNKVVQNAVKIINFVKSRALNSRLFANLGDEMESYHNKLLLHCEAGLRTRSIFNRVRVQGIFASPSSKNTIFRLQVRVRQK